MILRIQGHAVPVTPMREKYRPDFNGFYMPEPRTISIDPEVSPFEQADTLLHECIHALWDALEMGKRVTEENTATRLGTGLAELFRDNPALLPILAAAVHFNQPIVKE